MTWDISAALAHLRAADPVLGGEFDRLGPYQLEVRHGSSVFAMLVEAIVHQQLSNKAAATIYRRLCALTSGDGAEGTPRVGRVLAATDDELRGVGLSRAKLAALRDLAIRADDGRLPTP